jgi:hypothetical protein
LPETDFRGRAERAVQFLLSVQLPEGGFPGLEITNNRVVPRAFNAAQILHGLTAWHREAGSDKVRTRPSAPCGGCSAFRSMFSRQLPDGVDLVSAAPPVA